MNVLVDSTVLVELICAYEECNRANLLANQLQLDSLKQELITQGIYTDEYLFQRGVLNAQYDFMRKLKKIEVIKSKTGNAHEDYLTHERKVKALTKRLDTVSKDLINSIKANK